MSCIEAVSGQLAVTHRHQSCICVHAVQEPVHVFVAALVPSGEERRTDNIVAAELTVPMLCVSKRLKQRKNKPPTDYIRNATTEKLHYAWDDAIAALYDDKTPRW